MFLPPLLIALIAQAFASTQRRARIIGSTALAWMVIVALTTRGPALGILGLMAIGLVPTFAGAILGSELATVLHRIFGRSASGENG
jgi:hypothetical protein